MPVVSQPLILVVVAAALLGAVAGGAIARILHLRRERRSPRRDAPAVASEERESSAREAELVSTRDALTRTLRIQSRRIDDLEIERRASEQRRLFLEDALRTANGKRDEVAGGVRTGQAFATSAGVPLLKRRVDAPIPFPAPPSAGEASPRSVREPAGFDLDDTFPFLSEADLPDAFEVPELADDGRR